MICAGVCACVCVRLPLLFSIPRGVCQMQHVKCITKPMQTIQFVAFQIESKQKAANEQTQQQHSRHVNDVNVDEHHQYTTHTQSRKIIKNHHSVLFFLFFSCSYARSIFFPFVPYILIFYLQSSHQCPSSLQTVNMFGPRTTTRHTFNEHLHRHFPFISVHFIIRLFGRPHSVCLHSA